MSTAMKPETKNIPYFCDEEWMVLFDDELMEEPLAQAMGHSREWVEHHFNERS
jgi:hypothetical protein